MCIIKLLVTDSEVQDQQEAYVQGPSRLSDLDLDAGSSQEDFNSSTSLGKTLKSLQQILTHGIFHIRQTIA